MNLILSKFHLFLLILIFISKSLFSSDIKLKIDNWNTGYQAKITLPDAQPGWQLEFDLPDSYITNIWNVSKKSKETYENKQNAHQIKLNSPEYPTTDIGFVATGKPNIKNIRFISANKKQSIEPQIKQKPPLPPLPTKKPGPQKPPLPPTPTKAEKIFEPKVTDNVKDISKYNIVGYFPNWFFHKSSPFKLSDIQGDKLTHLNYAFAKPYTTSQEQRDEPGVPQDQQKPKIINYRVSFSDPWADCGGDCWTALPQNPKETGKPGCDIANVCPSNMGGNFAMMNELKKKYPHLKIMLAVGGWSMFREGFPAKQFSAMATNDKNRKEFVDSCLEVCARYGFDGIDIDWEYPGFTPGTGTKSKDEVEKDRKGFNNLLKDLNKVFKDKKTLDDAYKKFGHGRTPPKDGLLLTFAAPAGKKQIQNLDLHEAYKYLDFLNIMTYDFAGDWSPTTNHLAPLYQPAKTDDPELDVNSALKIYLNKRPKEYSLEQAKKKINLGMPLYGRTFANVQASGNKCTVVNPKEKTCAEQNGLFVPFSGAGPGAEPGMMLFSEINKILQNLNKSGYTYHWDDQAKVPWLYSPKEKIFISFDDLRALKEKAEFVKKQGLAGAMVWQLEKADEIWKALQLIKDTMNTK